MSRDAKSPEINRCVDGDSSSFMWGALLALLGGLVFYAVLRTKSPLDIGIEPIDVRPVGILAVAPSIFHAVFLVLAAAALLGRRFTHLVAIPILLTTSIEVSQRWGPWSGWGTYDPADLVFGMVASVGLGSWIHFKTHILTFSGGRRLRLAILVGIAVVTAGASSHGSDLAIEVAELRATRIDADTFEVDAQIVFLAGEVEELSVSWVTLDEDGDTHYSWDSDALVVVDTASCPHHNSEAFHAVSGTNAICKYYVSSTGEDITEVMFEVRAAGKGRSPEGFDQTDRAESSVLLDFSSVTTTTTTVAPRAAEPICEPEPPGEFVYSEGQLVDSEVLDTFTTSEYEYESSWVSLTTDGHGALLVGLRYVTIGHDPCVRGPIDTVSYTITASPRQGDVGDVVIRPALWVESDVYIGYPLIVNQASFIDGTIHLGPGDFTKVGGSTAPELVSGPPVFFGVVVGVSCPETSNCAPTDKAVSMGRVDIVVNPGN